MPDGNDARNAQGERERVFSALGSPVRMQILTSVATRAKSVAELARELDLHPASVRYHLAYLRGQGLLEEVRGSPGGAGRPAILYRASRDAALPAFPVRRFDLLAEVALEALTNAAAVEDAPEFLRGKGRETGRSLIAAIASRERIERWTPEAFERLVLRGLYPEFGIPTEVLVSSPDLVAYRAFSCPFLELARKMPQFVCDALDAGFHEGVSEGLGTAETQRVACMGHGDPHCEYRVQWRRAETAAPLAVSRPSRGRRQGG